ncbi:MAG: NOL1/NOP2/sun family putative RNA methylase [Clostridia bacterium]|nr:NOL1/NOP2/sun family putative RNA methylase [Clostridia bacterium]
MKQLPLEYTARMQEILGDGYEDYLLELEKPPVKAFRVNTDKISLSDFEKLNTFSNCKVPYVENAFYLDYEKIGNHPYHHAGMIYVQEPAAMAPVECIDINPEWKVLDMCAAPGGKSTQIKNKLGKSGVLVSNEIISSRCKILTGNVERLGLQNTVTTCLDSKKIAEIFPKTFDMIMVDAPCSGEGMFRKEEIAVSEWSLQNVERCAKRQTEILENAVKALKEGGYIVYATCTFSLEENEKMIDWFLQNHPEFELVPVNERVRKHTVDGISFEGCKCQNIHCARRFYPHISKGEGQFMAVLHNTNEPFSVVVKQTKPQKIDNTIFEFLDDVLTDYKKENVRLYNGKAVYFTPDFEINDGAAFSCGVTIGEIKKNYIQPHHQFFMALGIQFKRKIELKCDEAEVTKYLHGEEITADCPNGWAVVMVDGCALGGAKVVNGTAKNHYPKGLRK